jgi:putative hydrolase of the HAD superfamily
MIRAFLFDIGNVLLKFDFSIAWRRIAPLSDVHDPAQVIDRLDSIKGPYEAGQIDRAAFLRGSFDALGYRGTEAEFVAAFAEIFELNEPMAALVDQLAAKFPLYLLSNTNDIHHAYFTWQYPVFAHFRGGTFSHVAQASKPGPEIYQIACREHGLDPATTFFIDDLLPNIEAARELGFVTHHYHFEQHDALLTQLRETGLVD